MRNAYIELGFGANTAELSAQDISELRCAAQMAHLRYCEITADRQHRAELSPRELEVLRWIAEGKSNSVIADILGISRHTVDTMTRRMFEKLEVHDRTSAAVRGLGSGLLHYRHQQAG
jgi:LuxR family transcriptional regulator/LuxR family quorum-sensing system transcriptional regulator CciR